MSKTTIHIRNKYTSGKSLHFSHTETQTGRMAVKLAEHFGVICGAPDGYDEAGRAKLRLMTPAEVVERAYSIAELMIDRLIASGDLIEIGEPEPDKPAKADE